MGRYNNRRKTMLSWAVMKDGRALWTMNAVPKRAVYGESLRSFSGTEFRRWDIGIFPSCAVAVPHPV